MPRDVSSMQKSDYINMFRRQAENSIDLPPDDNVIAASLSSACSCQPYIGTTVTETYTNQPNVSDYCQITLETSLIVSSSSHSEPSTEAPPLCTPLLSTGRSHPPSPSRNRSRPLQLLPAPVVIYLSQRPTVRLPVMLARRAVCMFRLQGSLREHQASQRLPLLTVPRHLLQTPLHHHSLVPKTMGGPSARCWVPRDSTMTCTATRTYQARRRPIVHSNFPTKASLSVWLLALCLTCNSSVARLSVRVWRTSTR
jgi:hypothetical protein